MTSTTTTTTSKNLQRPAYIIEHMEDMDADPTSPATFPQWALLEYGHMLSLVGQGATVHFTGLVSTASRKALEQALSSSVSSTSSSPAASFEVHEEGILDVAKKLHVDKEQICLLDPRSSTAVSVYDAGSYAKDEMSAVETPHDGPFRFFLFGGILGDDPPRDRTGILRAMGFPTRHLGSVQMTTDTALGVTKRVVEDGLAINLPDKDEQGRPVKAEQQGPNGQLTWITHPEINFGNGESVQMPFRYMTDVNGTPLMPPGMREHIRQDFDRAFEF